MCRRDIFVEIYQVYNYISKNVTLNTYNSVAQYDIIKGELKD